LTRFGYFLPSEEHLPEELVRQAKLAGPAGFDTLWISDHYHPWLDEQGQSGFVRSVIGAISQATSFPVTTAVTCPLVRIHPAIVAQAAATCALPRHFRQLAGLISEDQTTAPCGPDPQRHIDGVRSFTQAGFDEVYVAQVGPGQDGFFEFYAQQVLPRLRNAWPAPGRASGYLVWPAACAVAKQGMSDPSGDQPLDPRLAVAPCGH
jgi:Luciferase-like monooxygenase